MNFFKRSIFFGLSFLFLSFNSHADVKTDIKVVTTIKPLHSLISRIMETRGEPQLIIEGTNNPHTFVFKPSHAKMIEEADIIFWIGEDLEAFMEKPLDSLAEKAQVISFMELSSIEKLKFREKNIFEGHDDHGHDEHGKKDDDHDEHAEKEEGHDDHGHDEHGHAHGEYDPHIWLDPLNAKVIVKKITNQLVKIDADNSSAYKANSKKLLKDLDNLTNTIKKDLNKNASFVVFHDAYQYFEKRFGLSVIGALTVNPDVMPGAEQLSEIREVIEEKKVKCIFSEPQFNPAIIKSIASDTGVKTGVLDPLGANINKSKNMYFNLIEDMSNALKDCS